MLRLACLGLLSFTCLTAAAQEESIPFELQDNLIRVPIVLNGRKADAVLDSGTGGLAVDRNFALSVDLKLGEKIGNVPGGGAEVVPMFPITLAQIAFGPERLSQVAAVALDMSHLSSSAGFPVRVLLGKAAFQTQALRIDYPGRKIIFLDAGKEMACADPLPLTFVGGTPVVTVTLKPTRASEPQVLHLIVDLGTRHYAVMLGGPFLDTPDGKALERAGVPTQVGAGTGGSVDGTVTHIDTLTIGAHQFSDVSIALTRHVAAFTAGTADGTLGVPLWKAGTITFDYPHQRLCLELPEARLSEKR